MDPNIAYMAEVPARAMISCNSNRGGNSLVDIIGGIVK